MVRFRISNMTCGGCAKGVAATLKEAGADGHLHFDLERREVELDVPAGDAAKVERVLTAAGWQAQHVVG